MASTSQGAIAKTAGFVGMMCAFLTVGFVVHNGAEGYGVFVPGIIAFFIGFWGVARDCPSCERLVFRGNKMCNECSKALEEKSTHEKKIVSSSQWRRSI